MERESVVEPPASISILFCPVCGRDDRFSPMSAGGKHYRDGERCLGRPVRIVYGLDATHDSTGRRAAERERRRDA